ncbi:MAG: WXG100 family type VII secretion target [Brachybacterium sp.]|nr:WXG100 family type VII secretion target [Brachybacterium sp.]
MNQRSTMGMNVEEVRQMAAVLQEAAAEIEQISSELTSGLEQVDWTGPDADRFRGQWQSEMIPTLQRLSASVTELSTAAQRNASEQESASASR